MSRPTRLRAARNAAGLSQAALAAAAGVSRQAIGAIEAGHHRPSVDAALAIARSVGASVELLFSAESSIAPVFGEPLPDGAPVLAARVGERVVYAPPAASIAFEGWPLANARLAGGVVQALPGADLDAFVAIGCDPALGSVGAFMPAPGPRMIALSGTSTQALAALRDGRVHAGIVHNRPGHLPAPPPGVLRLHLARWRVGVASRGRRPKSIEELCARRSPVVQREPGASTQRALARALARCGADALPGPIAADHVDVARRVAAGASAGVTMEPAARRFGLGFAALEEHVAELWVDERWRDHPGVEAVGSVLRSEAFAARLGTIEGYELAASGMQSR